ncbi:MAG TPA: hypothetical protein VH475_01425 [Tepidisphaeraceae bacterium]|jgi:hypothetical protein
MASLLDRIARRISPIRVQPKFPGAIDSYPSTLLSIDQHAPPPRRLIDLTFKAVYAAMDEVNLDHLRRERASVPEWFSIWPGEHYLLLAALVKVMQPRVAIEIGTDSGLSALCMKQYLPADGRIVTFDLIPWQQVDGKDLVESDFADGRLEQRLVDLGDPAKFEANRELIASAELFFIDGPKNVTFEESLMRQLATVNFAKPPILMFDDTRLPSMLKFWRELTYPKLDLTSFGHWSGTGLVELAGA